MTLWITQPVTAQPQLTLREWQVMQLSDGDRHLVGYVAENREGRVSSAIRSFDVNQMRAVTGTGRVYQLKGPPGINQDASYVWARWMRINDLAAATDVTGEVWAAHVETAQPRSPRRGRRQATEK